MSTCGNFSNLPCCSPSEVIVDDFCENINIINAAAIGGVIWSDPTPLSGVFTISLSPDSPSGATFRLMRPTVPSGNLTIVVGPGQSTTQVAANVNSINITNTSATVPATGKVCITVLRKMSQ